MADDILIREDDGGIATLTLNDPDRLNALSRAMLDALEAEVARLAEDGTVRAVILRGSGRAFCAGHDLRELTGARQAEDGGRHGLEALFAQCARLMLAIPRLPQPVIAQVHGIATAAGCQLVATCDLAVAAEGTRFGVNGINIGLFCATPMVALTRNVARKAAFEMLTTGGFVEAARAREIGLVNRVVPPEDLDDATRELAGQLAGKLGPVLRTGKRAFYEQAEMSIAAAYEYTGRVMVENMMRADTAEGVGAFLDKRPPSWQR
jgi:enoyl-CoA hydratase/carnithine racemase